MPDDRKVKLAARYDRLSNLMAAYDKAVSDDEPYELRKYLRTQIHQVSNRN